MAIIGCKVRFSNVPKKKFTENSKKCDIDNASDGFLLTCFVRLHFVFVSTVADLGSVGLAVMGKPRRNRSAFVSLSFMRFACALLF